MGDASWDVHNDEARDDFYADWTYRRRESGNFMKNTSTAYPDKGVRRNLVPTWVIETDEGLAASDNAFVTVDGDDWYPDLAIGRLPVVQPAEVTAIIEKIMTYSELAEVGPWRRNMLWIAAGSGPELYTDYKATELQKAGFNGSTIYPTHDPSASAEDRAGMLLEAFDQGQALVHFFGHGGRYIWRTGVPDYRENKDLFTLDDLDRLAPNTKLPLVLSMTCYSAPFDHPTADSIGEKMLRLPDRGAIAVLAASWRNTPYGIFSNRLMDELTTPGTTIGEGIMRAKQRTGQQIMVETYNLLGDPALELAVPGRRLALTAAHSSNGVTVSGEIEGVTLTDSRIIVDWLDSAGDVMTDTGTGTGIRAICAGLHGFRRTGFTRQRERVFLESDAARRRYRRGPVRDPRRSTDTRSHHHLR